MNLIDLENTMNEISSFKYPLAIVVNKKNFELIKKYIPTSKNTISTPGLFFSYKGMPLYIKKYSRDAKVFYNKNKLAKYMGWSE